MKKVFLGGAILISLLLSACSNAKSTQTNNPNESTTASSSQSHKITKVGQEIYYPTRGNLKLLALSNKQVEEDTAGVNYKILSTKLFRDKTKTSEQHDFLSQAFGSDIGSTIYYVQVLYSLQNNTGHPIFIWGSSGINGSGAQYDNNNGAYDSLQGKNIQPSAKMNGTFLYKATSSDKDNFDKEKMVTGLVDIKSGDKDIKTIEHSTIDLTK